MTHEPNDYRKRPGKHTPARVEHYRTDLDTLNHVDAVLPDALARMNDARLGYPSSSFGGSGSSNNSSSPVERALGLDGDDGHMATDPGRQAIHSADILLRDLHRTADALHHLTARWAQHQPDPKAKAATEAANVPECSHHRATIGTHEPLHVHSDVTGNLDQPMTLCRYCYEFTRRNSRLPSRNELDRVRAGQRVRLPAG